MSINGLEEKKYTQRTVYSNYKSSGVEWIGDIPENWEIIKLRYLCEINTGSKDTQDTVTEGQYPFFVRSDNVERLNEYTHDEEAVLTAGDGVGVGRVFHYFKGKFAAHQRVYVFTKFKNCIAKYIYYYLKANLSNEVLKYNAKSTVDSLRRNMLTDFVVAIPPISEQVDIVTFIEDETYKIDNLIEKKQRLIELLQEKRQALITNAVTKGLDINVQMKDSGIPWLGEVPEHWDVKRLRFMLEMNPGKSELTGISEELQVSFLPMESVSEDGDIELDRHKPLSEVFSGYTYFKDRDVILAKITPCFENGKGALVDNLMNSIGFGSTEFHVLRPKQNKLDEKYLYYIIKSHAFMNIGESMMTGAAGQKRVPEDFIKNYKIGLPPYLEQKTIVKKLEKKLSDIRALTEKLLTQITKLQEFRQALITSAVTGKIDVREKISS